MFRAVSDLCWRGSAPFARAVGFPPSLWLSRRASEVAAAPPEFLSVPPAGPLQEIRFSRLMCGLKYSLNISFIGSDSYWTRKLRFTVCVF